MPEAIAAASAERRAEIVPLLVDRVTATTGMMGLEWTPPAAPFFRLVKEGRVADGPRSRHEALSDPLAYYVA